MQFENSENHLFIPDTAISGADRNNLNPGESNFLIPAEIQDILGNISVTLKPVMSEQSEHQSFADQRTPEISEKAEQVVNYIKAFFSGERGVGGYRKDKYIGYEAGVDSRIIHRGLLDMTLAFSNITPVSEDTPEWQRPRVFTTDEISPRNLTQIAIADIRKLYYPKDSEVIRLGLDEKRNLVKFSLDYDTMIATPEELNIVDIVAFRKLLQASKAAQFSQMDNIQNLALGETLVYSAPKRYHRPQIELAQDLEEHRTSNFALDVIHEMEANQDFIDQDELMDMLAEVSKTMVVNGINGHEFIMSLENRLQQFKLNFTLVNRQTQDYFTGRNLDLFITLDDSLDILMDPELVS